jgi:hypothetical protein
MHATAPAGFDVHGLSFGAADRGLRLPDGLRERMELLFGMPLGNVRVHLSALPQSLGARAVVHGSDIYLQPEAWDPHAAGGWHGLGHALAHVRQSLRGWPLAPEGVGVRLLHDPLLEVEADRMAALSVQAFGRRTLVATERLSLAGPQRWDLLQI